MVDTVLPGTSDKASDRLHWEVHRGGEPLNEADNAYDLLYRKNLAWTIGQFDGRGDLDPADSAAEVFVAEYIDRGIPPWSQGSFRSYLWWQVRARCTKMRRGQKVMREADLSEADRERVENVPANAESTEDVRERAAQPAPAAKPLTVAFAVPDESDEELELLQQIVRDAADGVFLVLSRFPNLNEREAGHVYLRVQDLSSKTIVALMGFPSVDAERTNWYRLRKKVKDLYSVDLEDMIKSLKRSRGRKAK